MFKFFEAREPETLNDEAFRLVVAQTMTEMPVRPLSKFTEADGLVVGGVLDYVMYAYTMDMPPPPPIPIILPLPQIIPVPLPPPPLLLISSLRTPLSHHSYPGERPMTRPHSTGEKAGFHGRS